jgi:hypothetical protein
MIDPYRQLTCSMEDEEPPETVLHRANYLLTDGDFGGYDVSQNNCFHFGALFISHPNPKYFLFHPSRQIFRRMHGALNVGKKYN